MRPSLPLGRTLQLPADFSSRNSHICKHPASYPPPSSSATWLPFPAAHRPSPPSQIPRRAPRARAATPLPTPAPAPAQPQAS
uniref:Uncharacterized protein n=1 Tax=Arundo donax TaxID=35708 RepID=A0A0A9EXR4_ARUDO